MSSLSASSVINHLKSIFARHGTPEIVYSDNGPQFQRLVNSEFTQFARDWKFHHITSSPKFAQSNGFVEAGVKKIKASWKKTDDAYRALQAYRATPLVNGFSPAELLMGRRIRTSLPIANHLLEPKTDDHTELREWEEKNKLTQKTNFDKRHGARPLKPIEEGEKVWITDQKTNGLVKTTAGPPRSYIVKTSRGEVRRNRFHLIPMEMPVGNAQAADESVSNQGTMAIPAGNAQAADETVRSQELSCPVPSTSKLPVTQSGRVVRPVQRLNL